jgi:hypothetical protein
MKRNYKTEENKILKTLSVSILIIRNIILIGKDIEKLELPCPTGGKVKWYNCFGKQFGNCFKM